MLSSSKIKWLKSLSQKKFRKQEGLFIAEGDKIVKELLSSSFEVKGIYAIESWAENASLPANITPQIVSAKELERISSHASPNQALAVVQIPDNHPNFELHNRFTLVLDNIQDPGNLGTIIRTADWFGVRNIVCSEDTAEVYNPKVIQATMGSFMRVNVSYTKLEEFFSKIPQGFPVMGALLEGENIFETELPSEGIIVTGNESKGISAAVRSYISGKLFIPRGVDNAEQPESLNAAIATGIILALLTQPG